MNSLLVRREASGPSTTGRVAPRELAWVNGLVGVRSRRGSPPRAPSRSARRTVRMSGARAKARLGAIERQRACTAAEERNLIRTAAVRAIGRLVNGKNLIAPVSNRSRMPRWLPGRKRASASAAHHGGATVWKVVRLWGGAPLICSVSRQSSCDAHSDTPTPQSHQGSIGRTTH